MEYTTGKAKVDDPTDWRRKFALLPIAVEELGNGAQKKVWMCFVEIRTYAPRAMSDACYFYTEARLPGSKTSGLNGRACSY